MPLTATHKAKIAKGVKRYHRKAKRCLSKQAKGKAAKKTGKNTPKPLAPAPRRPGE